MGITGSVLVMPAHGETPADHLLLDYGLSDTVDLIIEGEQQHPIESVFLVCETASSALEAAEAWTGRDLFGGDRGKLHIRLNSDVDNPAVSAYDLRTETVLVNQSVNGDILSHEIGHALLHRLKPGWNSGTALIIHEALADMFVVLTTLRSRQAALRVLKSTNGNLDVDNEASEILEFPAARTTLTTQAWYSPQPSTMCLSSSLEAQQVHTA